MIKHRHDLIQRRITSFHESGHGCTAVALGLRFKSISIIPDRSDHSLGHIDWGDDFCWRLLREEGNNKKSHVIDLVQCRIVTNFAGIAAQRRFAPWSDWRHDSSTDRAGADEFFQMLIVGPPDWENPNPAAPWRAGEDFYDDESGDFYGDVDWIPGKPHDPNLRGNEALYPPDKILDRKTFDSLHARFRIRAAVLVARLWSKIQIVADELLQRKVLSFDEVRRLMNRARRHPR
jgi:hypothetical protein